jgi:hypothetical protein
MNVLGHGTVTVSSTARTLANMDVTLPSACKRAYFTCEADAVRWRADRTNPTAAEGHMLAANDSISFTGDNYRQLLEGIAFIRVTTDATLKVTYFD